MKLNELTYVDQAEKVIDHLNQKKDKRGRDVPVVTTSKLRNLLSMTMDIYNQILNQSDDRLSDEISGKIEYLRLRTIYECGREPSVKNLVEAADILDHLREIDGSKKNYILFTHYMEALVAFRKYKGNGQDS